MRGLLLKDWYLLKENRQLFTIILGMAALFTFTNSDVTFISTFITIIMSMMVVSTISYDDFDRSNSFLMTLPTTRKQYVLEKYVLGVVLIGIGWVLSTCVATVIQLLNAPIVDYMEWFLSSASIMLLGIFFLAIMIPSQLKFGSDKGRIAMIAFSLGIFMIGAGVVLLCNKFNIDLEGILLAITRLPLRILITSFAILFILCVVISYRISLHVFQKKQF